VQQLLQGDDSSLESDNFDWNTDDELEIESFNSLSSTVPSRQNITAASAEVSFYVPFLSRSYLYDSMSSLIL